MNKKGIFGWFWEEMLTSMRHCGFAGIKDFAKTVLKSSGRLLHETQNQEHYALFKTVQDPQELRQLHDFAKKAMDFIPPRTKRFYQLQNPLMIALLTCYAKDKALMDDTLVSKTDKDMQLHLAQTYPTMCHNRSFQSFFRKPAFFVLREGKDTLQIVVRGTVNTYDIFVDLDAKPELHDGFWFHGAFYASGLFVFEDLRQNNLLHAGTKYEICGHSLGGSVAVVLSHLIHKHVSQSVQCWAFGMSCVGDLAFSLHAQQFCTCVVNSYDMVPTISYHAVRVMLMRYMIAEFKRTGKIRDVVSAEHPAGHKHQAIKDTFLNLKDNEKIATRDISKGLLWPEEDLFVAGNILHFAKGDLFRVSVHDVSEGVFSIPTMLDHTGYFSFQEWAAAKLAEPERPPEERPLVPTTKTHTPE